MSAKRIQLRRVKGWRKPEGAIVVARPSYWGNPFRIGETAGDVRRRSSSQWQWGGLDVLLDDQPLTRVQTVNAFARWAQHHVETSGFAYSYEALCQLAGRDLACWCPLDQPCHADVLLKIANALAAQDSTGNDETEGAA